MKDIYVIVADAAQARLFSQPGPRKPLVLIDEFEHAQSRARGREIDSDSPGRVHDRLGAARHAMEAETDLKMTEARRFANDLGVYLAKKYNGRAFSKLALIAAPAFLGELRQVIEKRVPQAEVIIEVPKDLIHEDAAKILTYLD